MDNMLKKGSLEIICGSMFSGKTEELIRRINRARFARKKTVVFKPSIDTRKTLECIVSHNNHKVSARAVESPQVILELISEDINLVAIDEIQFFSHEIINVIMQLIDNGKRVVVSGLDMDFRGKPFGCVPTLMALANTITKLTAICVSCGSDAHFSQRLVNGIPAQYSDPTIQIGAEEHYQARCRTCFVIDIPMRHHVQNQNVI